MSNQGEAESLRSMILTFKVSELQALLGFAGKNRNGKKNELQARALELATLQSQPMKSKIQELFLAAQESQQQNCVGSGTNPLTISQYQQQAATIQHALQGGRTTPGAGGSRPGSKAQATPLQPSGVKLKRLPFYAVHGELVSSMKLVASSGGRFQEAAYTFYLTGKQATDIALNRDTSPGAKLEYPFQILLRFCPQDTTAEQGDEFPPNICVQVNGKMLPLPNPVPSKNNTEPRRPPKPVDVSKMCKLTPSLPNNINVKWASEHGKGWVINVDLVEKLSSKQLLERLTQKGTRDAKFTKDLIKNKLSDDDDGIATTNLKVTVACPLGKIRMNAPCRPTTCDHLQCFDAHLFLQMNEKKPTWQCPVCDGAAHYDNLMVDGYFLDVINSPNLPEDENEIILNQDGSWHPLPKNEDDDGVKKEEKERESIGDDEANLSFGKPSTPVPREIECIDID